ncbi:hypothetical protein DPEC_G00304390 [Dallia pectoralis]|uniref:Uncharacterized protein n=1 Tax=Dallia pectoralis TaxID=75939 RepID=A0ACC2FDE7_DALPE|nr:hypothetical protein DPEC_G00304390 [Dallia pectoralis]
MALAHVSISTHISTKLHLSSSGTLATPRPRHPQSQPSVSTSGHKDTAAEPENRSQERSEPHLIGPQKEPARPSLAFTTSDLRTRYYASLLVINASYRASATGKHKSPL